MKALKKSQTGQITIEAVLVLTLFASAIVFITREMRQAEWARSIAVGPWAMIAGMSESGVWAPRDKAIKYHPSVDTNRRLSIEGPRE